MRDASIVIALSCGAIPGTHACRIQANLPTPWAGVWERINTAAYMAWIAALAIAVLRGQHLTSAVGSIGYAHERRHHRANHRRQ